MKKGTRGPQVPGSEFVTSAAPARYGLPALHGPHTINQYRSIFWLGTNAQHAGRKRLAPGSPGLTIDGSPPFYLTLRPAGSPRAASSRIRICYTRNLPPNVRFCKRLVDPLCVWRQNARKPRNSIGSRAEGMANDPIPIGFAVIILYADLDCHKTAAIDV